MMIRERGESGIIERNSPGVRTGNYKRYRNRFFAELISQSSWRE